MRDIEKQLSELEINGLKFESVYFDKKNEERKCFNLDKEQVEILISGYSIPLRAKIVQRMHQLESQFRLPTSYKEAVQNLLVEIEKNELLESDNKVMKPKAIEFDKFMASDTAQSMGEVAKLFKIGQNKLFALLRSEKILMANNIPYQKYMRYFEVIDKVLANKKVKSVTLVKSEGVEYLSKRFFKGVK
jgi:phage antirepressor YoqD-like protein